MGKKELDDKLEFEKAVGISDSSGNIVVSIIKFILFIALTPLIVGISFGFSNELLEQKRTIVDTFNWGILTYLLLHIFVCECGLLQRFAQNCIRAVLRFFEPLRKIVAYCFPFYSIIIFSVYCLLKFVFKHNIVIEHFVFLMSFGFIMHLVSVSLTLRGDSDDSLKAHYYFILGLVYLAAIIILACSMGIMFDSFSFVDFIKYGYNFFVDTYAAIWRQFFVIK